MMKIQLLGLFLAFVATTEASVNCFRCAEYWYTSRTYGSDCQGSDGEADLMEAWYEMRNLTNNADYEFVFANEDFPECSEVEDDDAVTCDYEDDDVTWPGNRCVEIKFTVDFEVPDCIDAVMEVRTIGCLSDINNYLYEMMGTPGTGTTPTPGTMHPTATTMMPIDTEDDYCTYLNNTKRNNLDQYSSSSSSLNQEVRDFVLKCCDSDECYDFDENLSYLTTGTFMMTSTDMTTMMTTMMPTTPGGARRARRDIPSDFETDEYEESMDDEMSTLDGFKECMVTDYMELTDTTFSLTFVCHFEPDSTVTLTQFDTKVQSFAASFPGAVAATFESSVYGKAASKILEAAPALIMSIFTAFYAVIA